MFMKKPPDLSLFFSLSHSFSLHLWFCIFLPLSHHRVEEWQCGVNPPGHDSTGNTLHKLQSTFITPYWQPPRKKIIKEYSITQIKNESIRATGTSGSLSQCTLRHYRQLGWHLEGFFVSDTCSFVWLQDRRIVMCCLSAQAPEKKKGADKQNGSPGKKDDKAGKPQSQVGFP